jgi:hypothetical protein
MKYAQLIDGLMQFYTSGDFASEAVQAKNEFFELAGIFDEQSNNFEMKMAQFTDWFLFSRKLNASGLPPIHHFVEKRPTRVQEEDEVYYRNLANHRASLFEFLKIKGQDLHVRDMFSNYKLIIKDSPVTHGFTSDEYFQARLIPHEDSFLFSPSFCFHPPDSNKFILSEVKRVKKLPEGEQAAAREALLIRIFRMRNKFDQYRHVGIKEIYSNDSRLRV